MKLLASGGENCYNIIVIEIGFSCGLDRDSESYQVMGRPAKMETFLYAGLKVFLKWWCFCAAF